MSGTKILFVIFFLLTLRLESQEEGGGWKGKFEQLGEILPTPTNLRMADGSPGPDYWQQKADYKIKIILDDQHKRISGWEQITYHNQSPQSLPYLWLQLDQNRRAPDNEEKATSTFNVPDSIPAKFWMYYLKERSGTGGYQIHKLSDSNGNPLPFTIQKTMMRVDLPEPLKPGKKYSLILEWSYNINNRMEDYGRSGYEYFPEDGNYVYTIAQFYPRMAVYDDYEGWQHKQFLGAGEFALTFGDFDVEITVPADHLVAATGMLQNPNKVLSKTQLARYKTVTGQVDQRVVIANEAEARARENDRLSTSNTWHFKAENVRDFAFASSRKFIWDAQSIRIGNRKILAQSFYPKEGNPLWEKESTNAVINTLRTYSKYSFDFPYPVATSVHAAAIGMEYPMICFNFGRPNPDGSYTESMRFDMLGVIIHEVGHNFFPMIVNSDERQWTWMDEGINSFLEYLTEQECYENFPSSRGPARSIVPYMKGNKSFIRPIMTNSEQVVQLGNNAYGKPATALNILRETILGRPLFDKAFKTYAQRWAFKHPKPADFFRTMEDASGVDLDWFWRGWFYTIDHVDIAMDSIILYTTSDHPDIPAENDTASRFLFTERQFRITDTPDPYYWEFRERIDDDSVRNSLSEKFIYECHFSNLGGLVMPLLIEFTFESGKKELIRIPAEVWRKNENKISKVFTFSEKITGARLDPHEETADTDQGNNRLPREEEVSVFEKLKEKNSE